MIVEPAPSLDAEILGSLIGQAVLAKGVLDIDRLATLADTVASALNANEADPRVDATLRTFFLSSLLDSQPLGQSPEPDSLLATAGALLALGGAGQVELESAGREAGILVYQRLVETSAQAGLADAMPTVLLDGMAAFFPASLAAESANCTGSAVAGGNATAAEDALSAARRRRRLSEADAGCTPGAGAPELLAATVDLSRLMLAGMLPGGEDVTAGTGALTMRLRFALTADGIEDQPLVALGGSNASFLMQAGTLPAGVSLQAALLGYTMDVHNGGGDGVTSLVVRDEAGTEIS
eukprot:scaffold25132_cov127-Isochrysis_galbana.AAC.1